VPRPRRHDFGKEDLETIVLPDPDGMRCVYARVPRIDRRFASAMHTPENHAVRDGPWAAAMDAVLASRIPVAQLAVRAEASGELRRRLIGALEEGYLGGVAGGGLGWLEARVAIPDAICDTVDLDALLADYTAWMAAAGVLDAPADLDEPDDTTVAGALSLVPDLLEDLYADHLWDLGWLGGAWGLSGQIIHGLVVGDEPAVTCAHVLGRLLGDDRTFWQTRGMRRPGAPS
jgi:hypothetical protein